MQLKLRHLFLFVIACALLIFTNVRGGALLGIAVLLQMALLINDIELTRKSQLAAFKLFLVSIPVFLFWGGVRSFMTIYLKEGQYFFFLMTVLIIFTLSFLINLQVVFSYNFLKINEFKLLASLQNAFNEIKNKKNMFLKTTFLIFFYSLVPGLESDWKLVFAIMATHLSLNWSQVKKASLNF